MAENYANESDWNMSSIAYQSSSLFDWVITYKFDYRGK